MRTHVVLALAMIAALSAATAASGCNGLSSDCELNLTCPSATATMTATVTITLMPPCEDILAPGACDNCMQANCCQELVDCAVDGFCLGGCMFNVWPSPIECSQGKTKTRLDATYGCMTTKCATACQATDFCNPVTNNGCVTAKDEGCDAVFPGEFVCIPPYMTPAQICETCDNIDGPYCGPTLRCHEASGQCARYCCTDADCGSGTCVKDTAVVFGKPLAVKGDDVGICLFPAKMMPACDAPAMAASMGACVAGFPGQ